jgi:UDP-glucose:(heptosyl)LPS alpha-1,3-glucosyltransferase
LPDGAELLGRTNPQDFFGRIDILVHPATDEPFGMVMSEALTCGVPVVFSDQCGAADHLCSEGLRVLPVNSPASDWAANLAALAGKTFPPLGPREWSDLGFEHEGLYEDVLTRKS